MWRNIFYIAVLVLTYPPIDYIPANIFNNVVQSRDGNNITVAYFYAENIIHFFI